MFSDKQSGLPIYDLPWMELSNGLRRQAALRRAIVEAREKREREVRIDEIFFRDESP